MERIKLSENLSISRIVHGFWRLMDWNMGSNEVTDLIKKDLENGITTFDHADIYGNYMVEEKFGEILAREPGLRDKIQIVTKCGIKLLSENRLENKFHTYDTSKAHIIKSVEKSLENFKTDYIDLLLLHRPNLFIDPNEVADAFNQLKKEGKVKEFGVSNFLPNQYDMLQSYLDMPLVTNQTEMSVLELKQFENGTIEHSLENRISPMAWSPLAGGRIFSGNDDKINNIKKALYKVAREHNTEKIDMIMYAWLLNHPAKIIPVIGTGKWDRVNTAIESKKVKLTNDQWFEIYVASKGREID